MKIKDIIKILNEWVPLDYSEGFDNTGLLIGNEKHSLTGILITLDTLESVVDEAIEKNCNLIVSFHPIIFSGLKKLVGKTYVERVVQKAIKNDIAIFSMHTALDNSWNGVNAMICEKIGLKNRKILIPKKETIKKLITYVPKESAEKVRTALFEAGGGSLGNYENCSFSIPGTGSFKGNSDSNPVKGKIGEIHFEEEVQIGITFGRHLERNILQALFRSHPYEEVAYEISTIENENQHLGMGMIGDLDKAMDSIEFLNDLKQNMNTECIRYSPLLLNKTIKKVAVLGGSGSFAIESAMKAGADIFISADFKYHDFFRAENRIILADIGHYESEQFTKDLLHSAITKKFANFAPALSVNKVFISKINTNPISYL